MRSPAARLVFGAAAWIAFGAAAFFVLHSEQQLGSRRGAVRTFDVLAREASGALASLRAAQQAYVAPGQSLGVWMSKVDTLLESAASRLDELQHLARNTESREILANSSRILDDLRAIDKRARQYLNSDQPLMAADVIAAEGTETAGTAGRQIEAARQAEYASWEEEETAARAHEIYVVAVAIAIGTLVVGYLVFWPLRRSPLEERGIAPAAATATEREMAPSVERELPLSQATPAEAPDLPREAVPILKAAAEICTEFNRVDELSDLNRLLGQAAHAMDACGVVVWLGSPGGSGVRPVLAHGYSPAAVARMPAVPRSGDNAAAAAYRTGAMQIVLTRPGVSNGAIAAPLLSPRGCIGALTAEIQGGSETSDGVQALAAIVAAQLAGALAGSVLDTELEESLETRIASA
jgi:hypothetical protein